jgi:hypothetical protein
MGVKLAADSLIRASNAGELQSRGLVHFSANEHQLAA